MRELFRKFQMTASLALGAVPVVLVLFAYTCPTLLPWAWAYPAAYLVLTLIGIHIPGKWRLFYGIAVAALSLGAGILQVGGQALAPVLVATVFYDALFLWSLTMGSWPGDWELPTFPRVAAFLIHVVAQVVVYADSLTEAPVLAEQVPGLRGAFLVFLLLTVLSLNRESMNGASGENRSVSRGMRGKNTVMTLVLFGLAVLASFIPYIYDWGKNLLIWLAGMLLRLVGRLFPEQQAENSTDNSNGDLGSMLPIDDLEPSLFIRILEIAAMVVAAVGVLGLVSYLVYQLVKVLKGLLKRLWRMLEGYTATVSEDYQDEITDTRRDPDGERTSGRRRAGARRKTRRSPTDPAEAIRHYYWRLLRRHSEWTQATTARENIPKEMAVLYEQARYSDHPPTEAEAERFQTGTKSL